MSEANNSHVGRRHATLAGVWRYQIGGALMSKANNSHVGRRHATLVGVWQYQIGGAPTTCHTHGSVAIPIR